MLIFTFILVFWSPSRIGLHTVIFKKHIIVLIWCIVAAASLECSIFSYNTCAALGNALQIHRT